MVPGRLLALIVDDWHLLVSNWLDLFKKEYLWVGLGLAAVLLAQSSAVDFSNQLGQDEWSILPAITSRFVPVNPTRPLELLFNYFVVVIVGQQRQLGHLFLLALKLGNGFLTYLLVRNYKETELWFAFSCASLALVYIVDDHFLLYGVLFSARLHSGMCLVLLSLYLYRRFIDMGRPFDFFFAVCANVGSNLVYEFGIPLQLALPLLFLALYRRGQGIYLASYGVWLLATVGSQFSAIFGVIRGDTSTYQSSSFGFSFPHLIEGTMWQLAYAFGPILRPTTDRLKYFPLSALLMFGVMVFTMLLLRGRVTANGTGANRAPSVYLGWLVVGVVVTWLSLLLYLLAVGGTTSPMRKHVLAAVGEAMAVCAAIWWVSSWVWSERVRNVIRIGAVAFVAALGAVQAADTQKTLNSWGGMWETQAVFLRSIVNVVPAVKHSALIVYVENASVSTVPFTWPEPFQGAIEYAYGGQVQGVMSDRGGYLKIMRDGAVTRSPARTYRWSELIVITKDLYGRAVVLDTLPADLFMDPATGTVDKELLAYAVDRYRPRDLIAPSFVSPLVQEMFPPLQFAAAPNFK